MPIKTALIVDNSRLMRSYMKELLQGEGIENIIEASSADEAIVAFNKHKPELMTLDILMPGNSGLHVLEVIGTKNEGVNIIVVTDFGQEVTVNQALAAGARSVLYKPVSKEALKSALQGGSALPLQVPKPRALVVDDSMMMRALVREILEEEGCEVIGEAADVPQGIKAYQELKPDLMTLDLIMPGGSGIDVLKSAMAVNPQGNVIVVSAVSQEKVKAELVALGAKDILSKPLTPEKIREALTKIGIHPASSKNINLISPSLPKLNGDKAVHSDWNEFRDMLKPALEKCIEALGILSQSKWVVSEMDVYERTSYQMQAFSSELNDIVFVQMSVSNDVPIMGLFGAPHGQFLKMAQKILEAHFQGLNDKEGAVNLMILEWANIIVTNFINVFADVLGHAVMSSPPELIKCSVEEAIQKASSEISDVANKVVAAHIRFFCPDWAASCETILMVRSDCLDRILPKK